jgi:hypothetical protein
VDLSTFIVTVFYLVDDWLEGRTLRQRGPAPKLSDSEVLTIETVGEYLSIDTERGLYVYFRNHYAEWFPALREVHRTTFTRQMANLWVAKERLWQYLLLRMSFDDQSKARTRSPHFERMGKKRIYPFLCQMAKVELTRTQVKRSVVELVDKHAPGAYTAW